jgi:tRNA (cytidine/uridine-2'-O-)-methyltransferase
MMKTSLECEPLFHIILFEPEIPPNTGNIIRLCSNIGSTLHLVHPLGFDLEDKKLRRAGLDYREWAAVQEHVTLPDCLAALQPPRVYPVSTKGRRHYSDVRYGAGDAFLFGPETRGLPVEVLAQYDPEQVLRIPMCEGNRSLNLSNAAAIVAYEAWRQLGFAGGA